MQSEPSTFAVEPVTNLVLPLHPGSERPKQGRIRIRLDCANGTLRGTTALKNVLSSVNVILYSWFRAHPRRVLGDLQLRFKYFRRTARYAGDAECSLEEAPARAEYS